VKQPLLAHPARILIRIHWGGNVSQHADYISDGACLFEAKTIQRCAAELSAESPLGLKADAEEVKRLWGQVQTNERTPVTKSELLDEEETMVLNEVGFNAHRLALCLAVSTTDRLEMVTTTSLGRRKQIVKYPGLVGIRDDRPVWMLMPRTRVQ
jgi:hypothetical protein